MEQFINKKKIDEINKRWEEAGIFQAQDESEKPKKYILDMFPYPSGDGLHVGHVESYTGSDIIARYYRMKSYNVLHPVGWDAFGLPAENYAIKKGVHPQETTDANIENFTRQIKSLGFSYDWSREINTSSSEYYKWTQWLFLKLYEKGLAYKKKAKANWCSSCKTVLANEQVIDGACERCGSQVNQKELEQWFFKITDFADRLLDGLEHLDWPEHIKSMQRNWIGKSEGAELVFRIDGSDDQITVFTTRPDTLYGVTYVVLAPEHPMLDAIVAESRREEVEKYRTAATKKSVLERTELNEKTGVFTGAYAIHPITRAKVPIWVADYVITEYGHGAVMAVPAHDERDFEFAKKYELEIIPVIKKPTPPNSEITGTGAIIRCNNQYLFQKRDNNTTISPGKIAAFGGGLVCDSENPKKCIIRELKEELDISVNDSDLVEIGDFQSNENSKKYIRMFFAEIKDSHGIALHEGDKIVVTDLDSALDNTEVTDFTKVIIRYLQSPHTTQGVLVNSGEFDGEASEVAKDKIITKTGGKKSTQYRLRDWLVSRQRYWGAPIPIIYCDKCGTVPVPESDLPVKLPTDVDFRPTGDSPLKLSKAFHNVTCPQCGGPAKRESDTMDTFVCSSWYFLRFCDSQNKDVAFDTKKANYWTPVDTYIGGAEHAVLHLMYARFITKFLHDQNYIQAEEPFAKLRNQGMVLGPDRQKMSKSRGNVINPDEIVDNYGPDTLRLYEMFMGPFEQTKPWDPKSIEGVFRFVKKLIKFFGGAKPTEDSLLPETAKLTERIANKIETEQFNTCISDFMKHLNLLESKSYSQKDLDAFLTIMSPFMPYTAELLWQKEGHKGVAAQETWPELVDESRQTKYTVVVQVNGKLRGTVDVSIDAVKESVITIARKLPRVISSIGDKETEIIYVPGKVINFIIK